MDGDNWSVEKSDITRESTMSDLGVDSLDFTEIILQIEDEFGIQMDDGISQLRNIGDLVDYIRYQIDK